VTERIGSGGLHRRRFVQDGDVPVTVLRRDGGHDTLAQRPSHAGGGPTSSRLQRVEAALAAETAARERAERMLHEAHAVVRDLQTKIGHAELARNEAVNALQQEREAAAQLRRDAAACEARIGEAEARARAAEQALRAAQEQLQAESRLRLAAEKALTAAEAARNSGPNSGQAAMSFEDEPAQAWSPPARRLSESAAVSPAIRRRRAAQPAAAEQEPVKWWLTPTPGRRR
jgi:chromosome segregation protein